MKISTVKLSASINKYFDERIDFYRRHGGNFEEIEKVINDLREIDLRCIKNIESLNTFYLKHRG